LPEGASHSETNAAKAARTRRTLLVVLACVLLATLAAVGGWRFQRESQAALFADAELQARVAQDAADQANAAIAQAWGVQAGAGELGSTNNLLSTDPGAVARAASKTRAVSGAAVLSAGGAVLATSRPAINDFAVAAARELKDQPSWAGIVSPGAQRALTIARRVDEKILVTVFDTAALLPTPQSDAQLLLIARDGGVIAARPALADAKAATLAAALALNPRGPVAANAVFVDDGLDGRRRAVGSAEIATGAIRLYAAAPTGSAWQSLQGLAIFYLLSFGAPFAISALLLRAWMKQSSRRETAEAELITTKDQFTVAVDGARAGVFEWRPDADTMALSERVVHLLRAPASEMRYEGFLGLVAAEDREQVELAFTRARESGVLESSFRVRTSSGQVWIDVRGLAIASADQADSLRIVSTATDVTAQRETEMRAVALDRRLREAIDSYSGPFALWDARKRLVMWNRSFARAFNLPAAALRIGATYDSITPSAQKEIHSAKQDPSDAHIQEVELKSGLWLQMVERRTAEGGLVTVGADITALKRQEEALARSQRNLRSMVSQLEGSEGRNRELAKKYEEEKRKAEEASRAKSAFLANMSHELRTPLNAINGFSELMAAELFGPLGDKRYAEYCRDILASGQLLLDLINDILDMAKIEAGKITLSPQPLDPMEAVDQAVRLMRRRAEEKGLTLLVDGDAAPEIEADHRAVKQMLLNLMSNAVKFTAKGGVMVRVRPAEGGVTISVVDTGCGIPKEFLPRLGRAFEQVDMELSRANSGTGLGLALTKSLAEMHGGRLEIDSEVERGTIVTIFLPARAMIRQSEDQLIAGAA
jgi:two-component system, cell cycle sensor histidine kinase PleC